MQAFRGSTRTAQPVYGTVLSVLGSQLRVRSGPSTFTCQIAAPLTAASVRVGDTVLLTYVQDKPYAAVLLRTVGTAAAAATYVSSIETTVTPSDDGIGGGWMYDPTMPIFYLAGAGLTKTPGTQPNTQQFNAGEGPGIDVGTVAIGLGGDSILVLGADGRPASEFTATSAGLDEATASAVIGQQILLPVGTIAGDHVLAAGVHYAGSSRRGTILTGQITGAEGTTLERLSILRAAADETKLCAVLGPTMALTITDCDLEAIQGGAGTGYAVGLQIGDVYIFNSRAYGSTALSDGD